MPGFNGSGPRGMGVMTGRGRGNCASNSEAGQPFVGGNGFGNGFGRGVCRGFGFNVGTRRGFPSITKGETVKSLQEQAQYLKNQISVIESDIEKLEKE